MSETVIEGKLMQNKSQKLHAKKKSEESTNTNECNKPKGERKRNYKKQRSLEVWQTITITDVVIRTKIQLKHAEFRSFYSSL